MRTPTLTCRRARCACSLVVAAALTFAAAAAEANPWMVLGFDGYSMARGGALAGGASGIPAVFHNPAGLVRATSNRAQLTYINARPLLDVDLPVNPDLDPLSDYAPLDAAAVCDADDDTCADDVEHYNSYLRGAQAVHDHHADLRGRLSRRAERPEVLDGVMAGAVVPATVPLLRIPVAGGLGAFLPRDSLVYGRVKGATSPFFLNYDDAPHRVVVDLVAAVEPVKWLRIGGGVDILVDVSAAPEGEVILPAELEIGALTDVDPNIGDITVVLDGTVRLPWALAPVLGVQVAPNDRWDLGITFRDEQSVAANIAGSMFVKSAFGVRELPATLHATGLFQPRQLSAGAAWRATDNLQLFADVTWRQWSNYAPPFAVDVAVQGAGGAACDVVRSFHDLDNALSLGEAVGVELTPEDLCELIDGLEPGGPGVTADGLDDIHVSVYDRTDKRNAFADIVIPAVGVEYKIGDFLLAGGYRFEQTPAPDQTGVYNIYDADTHVGAAGVTYVLRRGATIGLFSQYRRLTERKITKDAARVIAESGDSDALPDPEFSTSLPQLDALEDDPRVTGVQTATPGYPGATIGGGYLVLGAEVSVPF